MMDPLLVFEVTSSAHQPFSGTSILRAAFQGSMLIWGARNDPEPSDMSYADFASAKLAHCPVDGQCQEPPIGRTSAKKNKHMLEFAHPPFCNCWRTSFTRSSRSLFSSGHVISRPPPAPSRGIASKRNSHEGSATHAAAAWNLFFG